MIDKAYLENMAHHVGEGGRLTHENAVELLACTTEAVGLLLEVFKCRKWPEEGQSWCFNLSDGFLSRLEDFMGLEEQANDQ
jgi:hypothetical protein